MKSSLLYMFFVFLFSGSLVLGEEYQHIKVINGFDSSCDSSNETQINNNRPIAINILENKKIGSSIHLKLEMIFLKCEKNRWVPSNQQLFKYQYMDSIGQKIEETIAFSKYNISILGKNEANLFSSSLSSEAQSKNIFSVRIPTKNLISEDKKNPHPFVELILNAEKNRKNAADIDISTVHWGKIKIAL